MARKSDSGSFDGNNPKVKNYLKKKKHDKKLNRKKYDGIKTVNRKIRQYTFITDKKIIIPDGIKFLSKYLADNFAAKGLTLNVHE